MSAPMVRVMALSDFDIDLIPFEGPLKPEEWTI
jgi:hypothetical protein